METKIISIDISYESVIPEQTENAGVMWEHNATTLVFNIDEAFIGDYRYYLEYRSLIGTKVRTEYLTLNAENNTVTYNIPVTMSSLKGVECHFNIVNIDDDGNTTQVIKPYKFCLQFDYSPDTDNSLAKVNDFSINALLEAIRLGTFKGEKGEKGDKGEKGGSGENYSLLRYATLETDMQKLIVTKDINGNSFENLKLKKIFILFVGSFVNAMPTTLFCNINNNADYSMCNTYDCTEDKKYYIWLECKNVGSFDKETIFVSKYPATTVSDLGTADANNGATLCSSLSVTANSETINKVTFGCIDESNLIKTGSTILLFGA